MSGSLKDALKKSGLVVEKAEPKQDPKKWKHELPEDTRPYVPFEAPAVTKPKES
jgi:hypothetical protein